jgi:hypothetical protein
MKNYYFFNFCKGRSISTCPCCSCCEWFYSFPVWFCIFLIILFIALLITFLVLVSVYNSAKLNPIPVVVTRVYNKTYGFYTYTCGPFSNLSCSATVKITEGYMPNRQTFLRYDSKILLIIFLLIIIKNSLIK